MWVFDWTAIVTLAEVLKRATRMPVFILPMQIAQIPMISRGSGGLTGPGTNRRSGQNCPGGLHCFLKWDGIGPRSIDLLIDRKISAEGLDADAASRAPRRELTDEM